jgi:hypothetical protein
MKIARKLKHPEKLTKEETYRAMCDARKQWLQEHQPKRPVAEVAVRDWCNSGADLAPIGEAKISACEAQMGRL